MSLPQLKFAPYIQPFVGGLSEETGEAIKQRLAQYYDAQDQADALGYATNQIKSQILPQDKINIDNIAQNYNNKLQEYVNRGDYENLGRAIKMDARKFNNEITPYLQQKQLYQDYLKQINDNKDISQSTRNGAIRRSLEMYQGYDPNNPNTSFKGYIPNKDINLVEEADKFAKDFKADSKEYQIPDYLTGITRTVSSKTNQEPIKLNKDGRSVVLHIDENGNFNTDNIGRPVNQIEYALRQYLGGNNDVKNYAESQAFITGSNNKFKQELESGIQAALQKHGFTEISDKSDINIPTSIKYMQDMAELNKPIETSTGGFAVNKYAVNEFNDLKFNPNTGNLQANTDMLQANNDGSFTRFFDKNGNQISLEQKSKLDFSRNMEASSSQGQSGQKDYYTSEIVPKEEVEKLRNQQNQKFDKLVDLALLSQAGLLYPKAGQNQYQHQVAQTNYLLANKDKKVNPQFREKVLNDYKNDLKEYKNIEVPIILNKNNTGIKIFGEGANILANLSNRTIHINQGENKSIGIKNNELEGANNYDELQFKLNEKGWKIEEATEVGTMFGNPQGNNPATLVTLTLSNKKGKKTSLNISAELSELDSNFKYLNNTQKIYKAIASGNSGIVNLGDGLARIEVVNIPLSVTGEGKGIKSLVRTVDENGLPVAGELGQYKPAYSYLADLYTLYKNRGVINVDKTKK